MAVLRFSAARNGDPGNPTAPWCLFAETAPGQFDGDARAGGVLGSFAPQGGGRPLYIQDPFYPDADLATHFDALPADAFGAPDRPVTVFVHGFQFEVRQSVPPSGDRADSSNPHFVVFHFHESASVDDEHDGHHTPWLARALCPGGTGGPSDVPGLALCFGYSSFGETPSSTWPGWFDTLFDIFDTDANQLGRPANFYELAYFDAMLAGHSLAAVLSQLSRRLSALGQGDRRINLIGHSLGTRTVMKALEVLAWRYPAVRLRDTLDDPDATIARVDKVVLLAGACLWEQAATALRAIAQCGLDQPPAFHNILSTADGIVRVLGSRGALRVARTEAAIDLDGLARAGVALRGGEIIGREGRPATALYTPAGGAAYADWVDINLNDPDVQAWGTARGLDLSGDLGFGKGDHWVHFTHAPNWALYRNILDGVSGYAARELATSCPRRVAT